MQTRVQFILLDPFQTKMGENSALIHDLQETEPDTVYYIDYRPQHSPSKNVMAYEAQNQILYIPTNKDLYASIEECPVHDSGTFTGVARDQKTWKILKRSCHV